MVQFDQLRISGDGKSLYVNAHVNRAPEFADRYIESITILTADKVSETNPWNTSEDAEYIYRKVFEANTKEIDLVITPSITTEHFTKSDFSSDLFFVYVKMAGTPAECVPCSMATDYTLGVTFDERLLYQRVMQLTKELIEECHVPTAFTDFILRWNAFKAAAETEHYVSAINFWKMLFDVKSFSIAVFGHKPCGCHG